MLGVARKHVRDEESDRALGRAWDGKRGRDRDAAEAYIGLASVMPLLEEIASAADGDPEKAAERTADRARRLELVLADATTVSPEFEGLHLYAEGIRHVFSKKDKDTLWSSPAQRADFEAHAAEVAKHHGNERFGQAGVTFAAALLAMDGDSASLFDYLPSEIEPSLRLSRATIRLWSAVIGKRSTGVRDAIGELLQAMPSEAEDPYTRGASILLANEANFVALGGELPLKQLGETAEKLTTPGWPATTRLRAIVDRAGVLSRAGDPARALELLEAVSQDDIKAAPDWANIAKGYSLVLKARAGRGAERKALAAELAKLGGTTGGRSFSFWRDAWVREIEFLSAMDACGKRPDCMRRAAKNRAIPDAEIEARLGRWLSALARAGTLSVGAFTIGLNYSTLTGLRASVDFSFALPAVEYPVH